VLEDSQPRFYVKNHPAIKREDFPNLPTYLADYFDLFEALLKVDPYDPESLLEDDFEAETDIRFYSHDLGYPLSKHRALDIVYKIERYRNEHYRIVYKIDDRPHVMKVDVYSFDRHDPSYDKAKNRSLGKG
jgi:mRNA interferase RelE/StbE